MPAKRDPNKPRGRMTGYAYFVQTCREEHKRKHPDEQVVFAEFSKKCAKRWKEMNEKEKKTFNDMTEMDRIRYEREMKEYVSRGGKATKRGKKKKDPNAPKRPQSAFFLFCADHRGPLRQGNPSLSVGDIAKMLGKKWAECSTETRKIYSDKSEIEKAKYVQVMEKYRASQQAMSESPPKRQRLEPPAPVQQPDSSSDEEESESEGDSNWATTTVPFSQTDFNFFSISLHTWLWGPIMMNDDVDEETLYFVVRSSGGAPTSRVSL